MYACQLNLRTDTLLISLLFNKNFRIRVNLFIVCHLKAVAYSPFQKNPLLKHTCIIYLFVFQIGLTFFINFLSKYHISHKSKILQFEDNSILTIQPGEKQIVNPVPNRSLDKHTSVCAVYLCLYLEQRWDECTHLKTPFIFHFTFAFVK